MVMNMDVEKKYCILKFRLMKVIKISFKIIKKYKKMIIKTIKKKKLITQDVIILKIQKIIIIQ